MGTPAFSVPGSELGGVADKKMNQIWEAFLEEVIVSWNLDKEQKLPKWRKERVFQVEGTAYAKALRWEPSKCVQGTGLGDRN